MNLEQSPSGEYPPVQSPPDTLTYQHEEVSDKSVLDELRSYTETRRDFTEAERHQFASRFIDALHAVPGTYYDNVGELYREATSPLVVRREDPIKALELLLTQKPIDIYYHKEFHSDEKAEGETYYNAAMWNGAGSKVGLENAFVEGFSHLDGIVTVLGFEPGEIIFHSTTSTEQIRQTTTLNYSNNVSIEGSISPEQLRFAVVRIPARYLSDEQLTLDEQDRKEEGKLMFVFRGVSLIKKPTN